jgi:hypothetical protein
METKTSLGLNPITTGAGISRMRDRLKTICRRTSNSLVPSRELWLKAIPPRFITGELSEAGAFKGVDRRRLVPVDDRLRSRGNWRTTTETAKTTSKLHQQEKAVIDFCQRTKQVHQQQPARRDLHHLRAGSKARLVLFDLARNSNPRSIRVRIDLRLHPSVVTRCVSCARCSWGL